MSYASAKENMNTSQRKRLAADQIQNAAQSSGEEVPSLVAKLRDDADALWPDRVIVSTAKDAVKIEATTSQITGEISVMISRTIAGSTYKAIVPFTR